MLCNILPTISDVNIWKYVGLNQEAEWYWDYSVEPNPMLNLEFQDEFLEMIRKKYHVNYTYGGFREDRSFLWRSFETDADRMIHLGVDLNNIPPNTPVATPCSGTIVHVMKDAVKFNGWGGRIIIKMDRPYGHGTHLMYGHLSHEGLPSIGQRFAAGEIVAKLGTGSENGGWFSHLHVQLMTDAMMERYKDDLTKLDGYALNEEEEEESQFWVMDPTMLIFTLQP